MTTSQITLEENLLGFFLTQNSSVQLSCKPNLISVSKDHHRKSILSILDKKDINSVVTLSCSHPFSTNPVTVSIHKHVGCYTFIFESKLDQHTPLPIDWTFGFELLQDVHWYGLGELEYQQWPLELNQTELRFEEFSTADPFRLVTTPLVLNSAGGGILINKYYDMSLDINRNGNQLLTFEIKQQSTIEFTLLGCKNILEAWQVGISKLGRPTSVPPPILFEQPIWTTWVTYKSDVDQEKVLGLAKEIRDHNLPGGVLEIDDRWQKIYGDTTFDPIKFPNPKAMVQQLEHMNFSTTCWVMPFVQRDSEHFEEAHYKGYFLKKRKLDFVSNLFYEEPHIFDWWQGRGAHIDFQNPEALEWFLSNLKKLQKEVGLVGFKFDAGEMSFIRGLKSQKELCGSNFSDAYALGVGSEFPIMEVRTGCFSQTNPCFVRQMDKFSQWGLGNGLHSVLTQTLTLSLLGYPFVLPDMVGGNQYGNRCDKELFLRWIELNACLSSIQLSIPPWIFDETTVHITRWYLELHRIVGAIHIELAEAYLSGGLPPVSPLFLHWPEDDQTFGINDQYMVGSILIAPVVEQGSQKRRVYLPKGQWFDPWSKSIIQGPTHLDADAPLDKLPFWLLKPDQKNDQYTQLETSILTWIDQKPRGLTKASINTTL